MHLHLDPVGGVAGDMFIAAVLDAFPHFCDGLLGTVRSAGLPPEVSCRVLEHRDHALTGRRFEVEDASLAHAAAAHGHSHDHPDHVPYSDIRDRLAQSSLDENVKRHAAGIFTLLAKAEAKVHGADVETVTFHELGSWDSIADIVGAAYLIDALKQARWSTGPLPLGRGQVRSAHGLLPVPAPATALLIDGFVVRDDGLEGERVTPTGAAILRYLACGNGLDARPRRLVGTGIGFGTRVFPGISNILRVLVLEDAAKTETEDQVAVVTFEVDDQSGEDLAMGIAQLRLHPGVLDVLQIPAFGKKGRMAAQIQILARPEQAQEVMDLCFLETSTIGVRHQLISRRTLPRSMANVTVNGRAIRVKITERPSSAPTAKAEMDDVAANGRAKREALRRTAEDQALRKDKN